MRQRDDLAVPGGLACLAAVLAGLGHQPRVPVAERGQLGDQGLVAAAASVVRHARVAGVGASLARAVARPGRAPGLPGR
jgi:hypothetical protein